jgi:hypothetical protein
LVTNLVEKKIGKVTEVEPTPPGVGNFVRAQVKIDVRKTLERFVTISRGGPREFYKIQFEKFLKFCGACGMLGHTHLECGTGEHDETKLKWGDFLKADRNTWHGRRGFLGGRGDGAGRRGGRDGGQGRGQGEFYDWRLHREHKNSSRDDKENPELQDTTTSPNKVRDIVMTNAENNARKRINFNDASLLQPDNIGEKGTLMITNGMATDNQIESEQVNTCNTLHNNKR